MEEMGSSVQRAAIKTVMQHQLQGHHKNQPCGKGYDAYDVLTVRYHTHASTLL